MVLKIFKYLLCFIFLMINQWISAGLTSFVEQITKTVTANIPPIKTEPEGVFCKPQKKDQDIAWIKLTEKELIEYVKDKKVLIMIHGLMGYPNNLTMLYKYLQEEVLSKQKKENHEPTFEAIICYFYNTYPAIDRISDLFATQTKTILNNSKKTYLIAHSMGGLVCRYALEQLGLGLHIKHLITVGTPHMGIPKDVFSLPMSFMPKNIHSVKDMYAGNKLTEKESQSPFLQKLNSQASEYYENAHYYTIAGNKYSNYNGLTGVAVKKLYKNLGDPSEEIDGIVSVNSAHGEVLESKSRSWKENSSQRIVLPLNHFGIIGIPKEFGGDYSMQEPLSNNISHNQIKLWIETWK